MGDTTTVADLVPRRPGQVKPVKNKFPKGQIGPQFVNRFMPWFEQYWHENRRYPSVTDIVTRFGFTPDQITAMNHSKFWLLSLERRGIARPDRDSTYLTERQVAAVAIIVNVADSRPLHARLAEINVTVEELEGWYSNPAFMNYLKSRGEDTFENVAPVAKAELAKKVSQGHFPSIKFYLEITGQATSPEAINVKQAMNVLIEAVQKHVKDPAILELIASEVQSIRGIQGV